MAKKHKKTYMRTGRLTVGLAQADIAALLGSGPKHISKLENAESLPTLDDVLLLQVIYEMGSDVLLGEHTKALYVTLKKRAKAQHKHLTKETQALTRKTRLASLERVIDLLP